MSPKVITWIVIDYPRLDIGEADQMRARKGAPRQNGINLPAEHGIDVSKRKSAWTTHSLRPSGTAAIYEVADSGEPVILSVPNIHVGQRRKLTAADITFQAELSISSRACNLARNRLR